MSEQEAERLYGPPPTGDEDPHASQAVPDPGDSRTYVVTYPVRGTIMAMGLSGVNLGQRVRISEQRGPQVYGLQGTLNAVEHFQDANGTRWVRVSLVPPLGATVRPNATVELLG